LRKLLEKLTKKYNGAMSAHHEYKNKTPKSESKPIIKSITVGAG